LRLIASKCSDIASAFAVGMTRPAATALRTGGTEEISQIVNDRGAREAVSQLGPPRVSVPCWPIRASSWNQISIGLPWARAGSVVVMVAAKFFERLLSRFIGLRMAGPHREPAVAELGQNLADRTFVQFDAKPPLKLVAQIHPPPTYDPMLLRIGTGLDQRGITMHPVPQVWRSIPQLSAALVRALQHKHKRQRQYPPRYRTVLLLARRPTKLAGGQIKPRNRYHCPHRYCSCLSGNIDSETH
jgi:hypothetical protein